MYNSKIKALYEKDYIQDEEIKKLSNYKGKGNYYISLKKKAELTAEINSKQINIIIK